MPTSKFWFKHDYDADEDPKLKRVFIKLGHEGKSVFWSLLQMLHKADGYLLLSDCDSYAFSLRTSVETLTALIGDFELFESDGERFWNNRILSNLSDIKRASEEAKRKAEKRWAKRANAVQLDAEHDATALNNNATAVQQQNECGVEMLQHNNFDATVSENDAAAMLDNRYKIIDNKNNTLPPPLGVAGSSPANNGGTVTGWEPQFVQFWDSYGKKEDRKTCEGLFKKLNKADREAVLKHVPFYVEAKPERQFRKDPAAYLRKRMWMFEELPNGKPNPILTQPTAQRRGLFAKAVRAYMVPAGPYVAYENELIPDRELTMREYEGLLSGKIPYSQFDREVQV